MSKKTSQQIGQFLEFLDNSPTTWHAVRNCVEQLKGKGFKELKEAETWSIKPGGRYYVTRNGSTLCAFIIPSKAPTSAKVAASHTDSPGFKLKPNAEFQKEGMTLFGLEIYGAPMLASWLNRDLGIAGRVIFRNQGKICEELVICDEAPVVIPQLAIHLDRNVNESGPVLNKQEQLAALAALNQSEGYLERLLKKKINFQKLLAFDLFVYPLEKAKLVGSNQEMVASYRIDSLGSVFAVLQGFLAEEKADPNKIKMAVFWDHEEVGSTSYQGAHSPFLPHIIERICLSLNLSREDYFRILSHSICASVDLAHAVHPNYGDKHEPRHLALMNHGIVIKSNAQQRYASDASSVALFIDICQKHKIPYQHYVSRGDLSCGSTIGPVAASTTGMTTIDLGCAQLSMHSARELSGTQDQIFMQDLIQAFMS